MTFTDGSSGACTDPASSTHGLALNGSSVNGAEMFASFASRWAEKVSLRYRVYGRLRRQRGAIVRVSDPALLAALALDEPLAYYAVTATRRARDAALMARNKRGKLIYWRSLGDFPLLGGAHTIGTIEGPARP